MTYRYTAHTVDGQSIVMEFDRRIELNRYSDAAWLTDTRNVQVKVGQMIALLPIGENGMAVKSEVESNAGSADKNLVALIDKDGDRWNLISNGIDAGKWSLVGHEYLNPSSRDFIEDEYGPVMESWE